MSNIFIDATNINELNKNRGIGIYTSSLTKYLSKVDKTHQYILSTSSLKTVNLIHYPYFDLFFRTLPTQDKIKQVVTIHDVIPLVFPKHFKPGLRGKFKFLLQQKALKKCSAIITDSKTSKTDIIKYLKIKPQYIHVIPLAAANEFKPTKTKPVFNLPSKYILYVGDVNYNKNLSTLFRAFSKIKDKSIHLTLVSQAWNKPIKQVKRLNDLIQKLAIGSRIHKISHSLNVSQLAMLYSSALVYVQPSLYEGFGLPILEAMACGTPVVSSNTSSLPEVCGKAAILVKPTVSGLTKGLNRALSLPSFKRKQLINLGFSRVKQFSWEKTARATIKVYNQVLCSTK